jgi:hypothetical protein
MSLIWGGHMAEQGRNVTFHGSFADKAIAKQKESETPNSYIRPVEVAGHGTRYLVLTRKKKGS